MIVKVHMLAFHDYTADYKVIREVKVPDNHWEGCEGITDAQLEVVFHYGQNDFQPVPACCSVSMGDVIELPDERLFRVAAMGCVPITREDFAAYVDTPRSERYKAFLLA